MSGLACHSVKGCQAQISTLVSSGFVRFIALATADDLFWSQVQNLEDC
jgi:hypothetical protein